MKTNLLRVSVLLVGFALLLLGLAGTAAAQAGYSPVLPAVGPISSTSGQLSGEPGSGLTENAAAFQRPVTAAAGGEGGGAGGVGGAGQIAFTGAETGVLAAAGLSLVLVGGAALAVSRKR